MCVAERSHDFELLMLRRFCWVRCSRAAQEGIENLASRCRRVVTACAFASAAASPTSTAAAGTAPAATAPAATSSATTAAASSPTATAPFAAAAAAPFAAAAAAAATLGAAFRHRKGAVVAEWRSEEKDGRDYGKWDQISAGERFHGARVLYRAAAAGANRCLPAGRASIPTGARKQISR
jgi:hypothetical protein